MADLEQGAEQGNTESQAPQEQQPGATPTGQAPAGEAGAPAEAQPEATDVPEAYDLKVPEGLELAGDVKGKFEEKAKAMGLSQDKAQELVDLASEHSKSQYEKVMSKWNETRESWVNDLKSDKDFGGDNMTETIERAKRSLDKFGSPALKSFLAESGYGDNAELVKLLARVDKATGEDKTVDGDAAPSDGKDPASILYPEQGKA